MQETDYSLSLTGSEIVDVQATGDKMLSVNFDVLADGAFLVSYSLGFPITTDADTIVQSLTSFLSNFADTRAAWARNAAAADENAQAEQTIAQLAEQATITINK